jgi:hypothetical protein
MPTVERTQQYGDAISNVGVVICFWFFDPFLVALLPLGIVHFDKQQRPDH